MAEDEVTEAMVELPAEDEILEADRQARECVYRHAGGNSEYGHYTNQ